ncbi:hypothetical protein ISTM_418 [Insectomime virus]|uniref:Uncharacterized protein n=1 Tax=Tunisvirus fontaine2 TaxID=1421067 RepID=V9SFK9_9VIRU|nr:hypothetical protein D1R32_gp384 [Tunisvirus fontaine2]AHA46316.1 hypothetical protein ISTM_418 [Insectomime virus]AHC55101.1 hypothetical protein TNS_ORF383 [Tunisvirus fontaine2]
MDAEWKKQFVIDRFWKMFENCPGTECIIERDGENIVSFVFQYKGVDLTHKLCWCEKEDCDARGKTQEFEWAEEFKCKFSCTRNKKCYLCA